MSIRTRFGRISVIPHIPKIPTIRIINPITSRDTFEETSRSLTGRSVEGFIREIQLNKGGQYDRILVDARE